MSENGVVTVFRPYSGETGILCLGTFPAWVKHEKAIKNDAAGVYQDDRFDVRIKKEHIDDIEVGDLLFFGRAEAGCVKTSECRRIAVVSLNSFGLNQHWHLRSEYRYS